MRLFSVIVLAIMLNLPFTGCLDPEDNRAVIEDNSVFNFDRAVPMTTWYHYGGNLLSPHPIDATNQTALDNANLTSHSGSLNFSGGTTRTFGSEKKYLILEFPPLIVT